MQTNPRRCSGSPSKTPEPAPARPIWARCSRPNSTTRIKGKRARDDQIGTDRPLGGAVSATGGQGCRTRGQDDPRCHGGEPGEGRENRDSRIRQLRAQLPAAAHGPQSEIRRARAGAREARPALQGGKGIAGTRRFQGTEEKLTELL